VVFQVPPAELALLYRQNPDGRFAALASSSIAAMFAWDFSVSLIGVSLLIVSFNF
jgi:hypothetical protein